MQLAAKNLKARMSTKTELKKVSSTICDEAIEKTPCSLSYLTKNRSFSYSTKESGSSVIFIQFYTRSSIEWR